MLTSTIDKAAPWTEPSGLRYIQNGDALNTTNHGLQATDVTDALNWFYGVVTGQTAPSGFTNVALLGGVQTFVGAKTFSGSVTLNASNAINGATSVTQSLTLNGSPPITLPSTTIHPFIGVEPVKVSGSWAPSLGGGVYAWTDGGNSGSVLAQPLNLIGYNGQVLDGVHARVVGSPTDVGLPANKFTLKVIRVPVSASGTFVQLGSTATDSSAGLAAFQAEHGVSVTGLGHTLDLVNNRYYAIVTGESGSGSNSGGLYVGTFVDIIRTSIQ